MANPLFSTYSQGENRVTASILAVFERISFAIVEQILQSLLQEPETSLLTFRNQPSGPSSTPDARIRASFSYWIETKRVPNRVRAGQLKAHLKALDAEAPIDTQRLLVLTPDNQIPGAVANTADDRLAWASFEDLVSAINEAIEIDSDYLLTLWLLTATHGALGQFDEAVAVAERAAVISERSSYYLGWLGWAYGLAGRRGEAEKILEKLMSKPEGAYIGPIAVMQVHLGLAQIEEAFTWLDEAATVGDPLTTLLTLPFMDPLRGDLRFQQIRDRVGIGGSSADSDSAITSGES